MPYINGTSRAEIAAGRPAMLVGELNFKITRLITDFLRLVGDHRHGSRLTYADINAVIGVLECAKLELYRRVAAPYEDIKRRENGDVYHL